MKNIAIYAAATAIICLASTSQASEKWYPLDITVWTPPFNGERKTEKQTYTALEKTSRNWNVCVSIPHRRDAYWLAVNYGLVLEARRLKIAMKIYEAGGYDRLDYQRQQIDECMAGATDALIIGAISAEGLNDLVEKYAAKGKPVIDLINGINSKAITARAAADFFDMGSITGEYLKRLVADQTGPIEIAWFPGPAGAGWSVAGDKGLKSAIGGSNIAVLTTGWGDTGPTRQAMLVAAALDQFPNIKYVVGTSVTAEAAVNEIKKRKKEELIKVLSYYFAPEVHRGILSGSIVAAPSDSPVLQSRLAVDLAIRALEKASHPIHVAAPIQMFDGGTIRSADLSGSLAPGNFRAVGTVETSQR